jgi:hypothetical protein
MMAKLPKLFKSLTTFLFLLLCFCSKQNKTPEKIAELTFEIDSTKLELTTSDQNLGIQFNAPKGWTPVPPAMLEQFNQQDSAVFLEGSSFVIQPISIFLNNVDKSLLYVSKIQNAQDSISIDGYKQSIQKHLVPTKMGDFRKDGIIFTQFLIQDENRVNFKLLFFNSKNQLIQFDYIVPKDVYLAELKAIESSIGSLKLIG